MKKVLVLILVLCSLRGYAQTAIDTSRARVLYDSLDKAAKLLTKQAEASAPPDTGKMHQADILKLMAARQKAMLDSMTKRSLAAVISSATVGLPSNHKDTANGNCDCIAVYKPESNGLVGWLLVFTPLLIFILTGVASYNSIKGFKITDALSENAGTKVTMENPLYKASTIGLPATANAPNQVATLVALSTLVPPTIDVTPFTSAPDPANPVAPQIHTPAPVYRPSISRFIALLSTSVIIVVVISMSCLFIYRYVAYGCPPDFSHLTGILIALGIGMAPYAVNKIANAATDKDHVI